MKLTKAQIKQRNILTAELEEARSDLANAISEYNSAVSAAFAKLTEAKDEYNGKLEDARNFAADVVQVIDDYTVDKSDKWQESDKAQEIQSWRDTWDSLNLEDIEFDEPDELDDSQIEEHNILIDDAPEESSS